MVYQLSLLNEETKQNQFKKTNKKTKQTKNSRKIYVYIMKDILTMKLYIGISVKPYYRFNEHLLGVNTNKAIKEIARTRPQDLEHTVKAEFLVENYNPKDFFTPAHAAESFLISHYKTIGENGFNSNLFFYHDFKDRDFWKEILTPELMHLYEYDNLDDLNEYALEHYSEPKELRMRKPSTNLVLQNLCIDRMEMYENLNIAFRSHFLRLIKKDQSNYTRFKKGSTQSISIKNVVKGIALFEEYIDRNDRFDLDKEFRIYLEKKSN